jgi:thymidylate kinase
VLLDNWCNAIDAVFLFKADPNTSLERENEGKLITDPGRAMNPEFLDKLNTAYGTVKDKFSSKFAGFFEIDTSVSEKSTPQSTAAKVVDKIIGILDSDEKS